MKFKEKRGNKFVFDGDYAGLELEIEHIEGSCYRYKYEDFFINKDLSICSTHAHKIKFSDIQTAVNLMQILIKEGLV